jgi:putative dimethyl sulfoxide reductase chaperone
MTAQEKETFCDLMAALFSPPEAEGVEQIRREAFLLEEYVRSWGGDAALLVGLKTGTDGETFFRDLQAEHDRLFSGAEGETVSLVESCYKPWTQDPECHLSFARGKGLLQGDSALHMEAVFRQSGVEVPEGFKACPDHLVLELELLSALYGEASDREVKAFIHDHLDWIPEMKRDLIRHRPHPFYLSAAELLDVFLSREKNRLETGHDGKKSLH